MGDQPVPVTLVTGFLGAGKTTLVNRVLQANHGQRVAVVVNEFGDVGIDARLVVSSDEEVVELANGCVCCTIRGDLVRTLKGLLARRRRRFFRRAPFERLLIESSGLASPGPILQTLKLEDELSRELHTSSVVTLVHTPRLARDLAEHPEVAEQLGYATSVILNHADRVDAAGLLEAERLVAQRNPTARVQRAVRAEVDLAQVLSARDEVSASRDLPELACGPEDEHPHRHTHGAASLVLRSRVPLDLQRLKMWLSFLTNRRTHELWRAKGVLACVGESRAVVVQSVHQWLELGPGAEPVPEESVLVLIGRDLDRAEIERGWETCRGV